MIKVPYRDLSVGNPLLRHELLQAVDSVLAHGRLVNGPELTELESKVATYCGRAHCIGVASGSDALYLALRAAGIGFGDEVITTSLSWIATANAIVLTGATPVFVDIAPDLNIDAALVAEAVTARTRAIVPVHFTGQMCDMRRILAVAADYNLLVIEDGAQAFGATRNGVRCGESGVAGCFSMNPMKVLCAYGEAGAIVTDDNDLRDRLRSMRHNGTVGGQDCYYPCLNHRLDTLQAAMLLVSLQYVEARIEQRRAIAAAYTHLLAGVVQCPSEHEDSRHTYYSYSILAGRRDELRVFLAERGIETQIQHPMPMSHHTAYRNRLHPGVPVCEDVVKRILCLPNHSDLSADAVEYVSTCVRAFYAA